MDFRRHIVIAIGLAAIEDNFQHARFWVVADGLDIRALRELRRASDEFRSTVETNLHINDPDPIIPPATSPLDPEPAGSVPVETAPVSTSLEPAPAVAVEPGEPYCAQRTSRLFHKSDCAWVARIPEADRAYFKHVVEAREQGFTTCPVCEPWEPA